METNYCAHWQWHMRSCWIINEHDVTAKFTARDRGRAKPERKLGLVLRASNDWIGPWMDWVVHNPTTLKADSNDIKSGFFMEHQPRIRQTFFDHFENILVSRWWFFENSTFWKTYTSVAFRRLKNPRCREMSVRGYALHSVCPLISFCRHSFSSVLQMMASRISSWTAMAVFLITTSCIFGKSWINGIVNFWWILLPPKNYQQWRVPIHTRPGTATVFT